MKVKTPTKKTIAQTAVKGVGTTVGVAVGRGVNAYYPRDKKTSGIAKIGTALATLALVSSVSGNDHLTQGLCSTGVGFAGEKLISGVSDILQDQKVLVPSAEDSEAKKFALRALDIDTNCGCGTSEASGTKNRLILPSLNYAKPFSPSINMMENTHGVFTAEQFV